MRVAVAGATGVLGRAALPALRDAGHEVRGFARSVPEDRDDLVSLDLFDRDALLKLAREWQPEAILHIATAIPPAVDPRRAVEQFGPTNRLRTEGTANLVAAAEAAGGARLIAESIAFMNRPGEGLAGEEDPLRDQPGDIMEPIATAVAELERRTVDAGGTVLRFGWFYGPGTGLAADGGLGRAVAERKLPILTRRGRSSTFSFIHTSDAAAALVAAVGRDVSGVFNIVDDDPATAAEWMPALAAAYGGKPPRRLPAWLARPMAGAYGVAFMTELRGASNVKAKAELGWAPSIPSWREGFAAPTT